MIWRHVVPTLLLIVLVGCGTGQPGLRSDPVEVSATVKLPGGASPNGLTVTFQPWQNSLGANATVGADGTLTTQLAPGKYSFFFSPDSNSKVAGFKAVPETYRSPTDENVVTIKSSGESVVIEVK